MTGSGVDVPGYAAAVRAGTRRGVARAITLVESRRPQDRDAAARLLAELAPTAGRAHRIGVTGIPGAGKSTFIDVLGTRLTDRGHRVAVLAVDPSSAHTGGSILGDRTRMSRLAADPAAYIRPSPSAGSLGGITRATRDAMTVVEAAGYDIVVVETVGTGQSETAVAELVDTFLLLVVAGTGDGLQGIKMGVLELADLIAVNKADDGNEPAARAAARELAGALRLFRTGRDRVVLTCSARNGTGLDELCDRLLGDHARRVASGAVDKRRRDQRIAQVWTRVRTELLDELDRDPRVLAMTPALERAVLAGAVTPGEAADRILAAFRRPHVTSSAREEASR